MSPSVEGQAALYAVNLRMRKRAYMARKPLTASFEVTSECNLRCVHCYLPPARRRRSEAPSTAEALRIVDTIADTGVLWLVITGGEPLLRADILDICRRAKRVGLLVTLFTNGTLVTPELAAELARIGPFKIEVSAYGRSQRTYEKVTQVRGSFAAYRRGVHLLRDAGLLLALKTPAMRCNHHEILDLEADCRAEGMPFRYDACIWERVDGGRSPCRLRLSPEQVLALDARSVQRREAWLKRTEDILCGRDRDEDKAQDALRLYSCGAGRIAFDVDSSGTLRMCRFVEEPSAPLLAGGFWEVWNGAFAEEAGRRRAPSAPCATCRVWAYCGVCSAFLRRESGVPEKPPEDLCELARLRAARFMQLAGARDAPPPRGQPVDPGVKGGHVDRTAQRQEEGGVHEA